MTECSIVGHLNYIECCHTKFWSQLKYYKFRRVEDLNLYSANLISQGSCKNSLWIVRIHWIETVTLFSSGRQQKWAKLGISSSTDFVTVLIQLKFFSSGHIQNQNAWIYFLNLANSDNVFFGIDYIFEEICVLLLEKSLLSAIQSMIIHWN